MPRATTFASVSSMLTADRCSTKGRSFAGPCWSAAAPSWCPAQSSGGSEVEASLQDLLRETGLLAIASCLFGFAMFFAVRTFPLRVLDQTLGELANTNSQFDAAINNMSQGLLLFDSSKRIVVVNRKYIEMYGLSPDVVRPGLTFEDLIRHRQEMGSFAGDVKQYCADVDASLTQGKAASSVVQMPDGRSIHLVNQPMEGGSWVATHEDVTDQHNLLQAHDRAEALLREQKLQLDTALNNMMHGLCMFDAQGQIVLFNHRYTEMMALPAESLLGRSLLDILKHRKATGEFTGDPEAFHSSVLAAVRARETTAQIMVNAHGRSLRVVDHPMANGGWVATFEDITEQRRTEEERDRAEDLLREQKLQLDTALNNMVHGLCMFDAQGQIILFNHRYTEMMGLPAESLLGRSLLDVFKYRKATGEFTGDPEAFYAAVLAEARAGKTEQDSW